MVMEFKDQYKILLREVAKEYKKDEIVTALYPMKGLNYNRELMVIGQAVNGWSVNWNSKQVLDDRNIEIILNDIYLTTCPMKWVVDCWGKKEPENYNTKKSQFWSVINKTLKGLKIIESDRGWSSYIVWTNLYKIAPHKSGNPSKALMKAQREICNNLLELEINHFEPKRILLLTGINWSKEFTAFQNYKISKYDGKAVGEYKLNNGKVAKYVIAPHPRSLKGSQEKMVKELVELFSE